MNGLTYILSPEITIFSCRRRSEGCGFHSPEVPSFAIHTMGTTRMGFIKKINPTNYTKL
jgi:hypothetical protein